jgi:hypothetical protein
MAGRACGIGTILLLIADRLEPISIGLERERGGGVVDIFPEMEMIDGAALFGRSA